MPEHIDPKLFGLPSRTRLEQDGADTIHIVIKRKSRIIMKNGETIAAKAKVIQKHSPGMQVVLKTTAPVCSKTKVFLQEQNIEIVELS